MRNPDHAWCRPLSECRDGPAACRTVRRAGPGDLEDPRPLTLDEIAAFPGLFAAAARRARAAGFDGVEVHGAHGYLLNEFTSPYTNRRTDSYGGDLTNRLRLVREVLTAVRDALEGGALLYRFGADDGVLGGITPAMAAEIAPSLVEWGVQLLDCSGGLCGSRPGDRKVPGYFVEAAAAVKAAVVAAGRAVPVAAVGGVAEPAFADRLVREGTIDAVCVGRAQLSDPEWARKALASLRLAGCEESVRSLECHTHSGRAVMTRAAGRRESHQASRRELLRTIGAAAGAAFAVPRLAAGQAPQINNSPGPPPATARLQPRCAAGQLPGTPDVVTSIPRSIRSASPTCRSSDSGPARCGPRVRRGAAQGRYLVWSDIPNNRQLRYLEDDGRVRVFRAPSNNSNGNTFDFQGRQCVVRARGRRVVRYQHDGTITVHCGEYQGSASTRRTSGAAPGRQLLVHRSVVRAQPLRRGGGRPGRPGNPEGRLKSTAGQAVGIGTVKREMTSANVYRVDPAAGLTWWSARRI